MTRCGQSATFCGIFQCWCCLPEHICILQFDWALFKGSCRMDCAEACPLPDQEGCHPMKHCQPPWRRQSEPEISSEFRVQLRSEDPGRFSGAGSAAFSGWRPAMRKACCPQRAGKSGQTAGSVAGRCLGGGSCCTIGCWRFFFPSLPCWRRCASEAVCRRIP